MWYTHIMRGVRKDLLAAIGPAKALALGCYGEDMAAFRYLQLSEKAEREQDRREFQGMVTEEQQHRDRLQTLLDRHFPDSEFVLTPEEKQMVECGGKTLHITDRKSFEAAVLTVIESERITSQFYDQMAPHVDIPDIKAIFRELADEGVEHRRRLLHIAAENNIQQVMS